MVNLKGNAELRDAIRRESNEMAYRCHTWDHLPRQRIGCIRNTWAGGADSIWIFSE